MTKIDIDQLAKLACIKVSETEHEKLASDVAGILDYVQKIQTVVIEANNEDEVTEKIVRSDEVDASDNQVLIDAFADKQNDLLVTPVIGVKDQTYEA